jgi:hypothetical protein
LTELLLLLLLVLLLLTLLLALLLLLLLYLCTSPQVLFLLEIALRVYAAGALSVFFRELINGFDCLVTFISSLGVIALYSGANPSAVQAWRSLAGTRRGGGQ